MIVDRYPLVVFIALSFAIGIALAFKLATITAIFVIFILGSLAWFLLRKPGVAMAIAIFLLLGLFLGSLQKSLENDNSLKKYYEKQVSVEGLVVSDVVKKNRLYGFELRVYKLNGLKADSLVKAYTESGTNVAGDYIRLKGLAKPQSIIFSRNKIERISSNNFWFLLGKLRRWIKRSLFEKRSQSRAFLYAMLTGSTDELSFQSKTDLKASGLAHLWAVSGLHTGFVVLLIMGLLRLIRLKAGWQLVFLIFALYLFAAFTGFKPPVIRASIMASWMGAAYLLGRKRSWPAALSSAALTSLLINPSTLFDPSFQLSYAAVGSLLAFNGKIAALIDGLPLKLKTLLSTSLSVQVLTLPLLAYYFGEIPVFGFLANILVIPVAALAFYFTILGLLFKAAGVSIVLEVPSFLGAYILKIATFFNSFPASTLAISPLIIALLVMALVVMAVILQRKSSSVKFSSIAIGILLFIAIQQWWPVADTVIGGKKLTVDFLDVGQGDASLITGPEQQRILVDGGRFPYTIQRDLTKRGIKIIDLVIPSHADADHIGGLPAVLRNFKVKAVLDNGFPKAGYLYRDFRKVVRLKKIPYILARRGEAITVGKLKLQILSPPEGYITGTASDDNNNSIVLKLKYKRTSFLFTGDLAFEGERSLVDVGSLQSTVLKVGHHGSAYSTSSSFLNEVKPLVAVISVGAGNNYGHPAPSLLRRLSLAHAKIYRTDMSSDIRMVVNDKGLTVYD